jgi:hypothetical protein
MVSVYCQRVVDELQARRKQETWKGRVHSPLHPLRELVQMLVSMMKPVLTLVLLLIDRC